MCRSVEVFGSHVRFVVGASHLSQTHDLVTNGVLDPQPTNLDVSGLSNARSGTHPDRSRRVRFDVDVGSSSHLLVHVLCDDSSCRPIHDSVELCFSGTQCSHLIGCNPRIHEMFSMEFHPACVEQRSSLPAQFESTAILTVSPNS